MPNLSFETPLAWPEWMPVTPRNNQRNDHGFTPLTLEDSIQFLDQEIQDIGGNGVLSLDVEQPLVPRLRKKTGSRTGVALKLRWQAAPYMLACDRWHAVEHNVYALHLAFRQWRNIEKWGIAPLGVLLRGFDERSLAGAPVHSMKSMSWMDELGLGPTSTLEDAVAIYHRRAKLAAQDEKTLTRLNILMEEARAYFADKGN